MKVPYRVQHVVKRVSFAEIWVEWSPLAAGILLAAVVFTLLPRKASATECSGAPMGKRWFQAEFSWKGKDRPVSKTAVLPQESLQLTIARPAGSAFGAPDVAQIWSPKGGCQAVCESLGLERDESGKPSFLKLNCKAPHLKLLTVPVTVFWPAYGTEAHSSNRQDPMVIRFGSWLEGFEQTSLQVSYDRADRTAAQSFGQPGGRAIAQASH